MTYQNAFRKQSQALNRGGIVEGLGLYQQPSETPTNTTKLLILVISGWPTVWIRIRSKHVWGERGRQTIQVCLGWTPSSPPDKSYIQHNCSCSVLVCGELKPHWQAIKWYQLSKQIRIAYHQLMRENCLFVGNGDCKNGKKKQKQKL